MILKTDRLVLRKFIELDLDDLAAIMGDEEVMRFSISGPLSKEQTKQMLQKRGLEHYEKYGFGLYAVVHQQEQCLIGFVGLITQQIDGEEKIELAYRFSPQYWGKGLATEAALAICHYAFDTLKMDQLISIIDPKNRRSLQVASRLGMHYWKDASFHGSSVHIYALNKVFQHSFQNKGE